MQTKTLSETANDIVNNSKKILEDFKKCTAKTSEDIVGMAVTESFLPIIQKLSLENAALLAKNKDLEEELEERKAYIVANPCAQCGGRINAMKCGAWAKKANELEAKVEIVEERLEKFIVDPYPESIFPKVSEDQIKKIHDFCQKELGFPIDRLSAAILRPCWKLISDEISGVLKEINKQGE